MLTVKADNTADLASQNLQNVLDTGTSVKRKVGDWCMKPVGEETLLESYMSVFELTDPRNCVSSQHCLGAEIETEDYLLGLNPGYVHFSPWNFYSQWLNTEGRYPYTYGERGGQHLPRVIKKLQLDPTTRHCVINLWDRFQDFNRDFVPCTTQWQFFIADDKLSMSSTMRSQDACRGFFLDTFAYPLIQQYVAKSLSLEMGSYYHIVLNSHVYESDIGFARLLLERLCPIGKIDFPLPDADDFKDMEEISKQIFHKRDIAKAEEIIVHLPWWWQQWKRSQMIYTYTKYKLKDPVPVELTCAGVIVNVLKGGR